MTDEKRTEENCVKQQPSCGSVLPIQAQGCFDDLENVNPMKAVIA